MEIKINKDIHEYTESIFFGLSLRQTIFSISAVIVAIGIYFCFKSRLGVETVSWVCMLGAAPFAALGFINYHGMNAEELLWAFLKSEIIEPKQLIFESSTLYRNVMKENLHKREREGMKSDDKNNSDNNKKRKRKVSCSA